VSGASAHDRANQREPDAMSNQERELEGEMPGLEAALEHAYELRGGDVAR
jgi:hypothetical protein